MFSAVPIHGNNNSYSCSMASKTSITSKFPTKVFIDRYPNLESLFKASLNDIMKIWSGLGFYRRAENIYKTSIIIQEEFDGEFPKNYNDILSLPGIGRTTASAITTFSSLPGEKRKR